MSIIPVLLEKVTTVNLDLSTNLTIIFTIKTVSKTSIELFVVAFFRIMCKCGSCDSRKRTPSQWERHTGSRAKKWKYSVKVKSTMLPLEKWFVLVLFISESRQICMLVLN
jgi:hypothetical protein